MQSSITKIKSKPTVMEDSNAYGGYELCIPIEGGYRYISIKAMLEAFDKSEASND